MEKNYKISIEIELNEVEESTDVVRQLLKECLEEYFWAENVKITITDKE